MKGLFLLSCWVIVFLFMLSGCDTGDDSVSSHSPETDGDSENGVGESAEDSDSDELHSVDGDTDRDGADEADVEKDNESGWVLPDGFEAFDPAACQLEEPIDWGGIDPAYERVHSGNAVLDKNFYLLTLLIEVEAYRQSVLTDPALSARAEEETADLATAAANCAGDVACAAGYLTFDETDLVDLTAAFTSVFNKDSAPHIISEHLRPSGMFHLYSAEIDSLYIEQVLTETFNGLAGAFSRFGNDLGATGLNAILVDQVSSLSEDVLFFEPLLQTTLAVMAQISRDEAGRYEPMEEGENKAALDALSSIDWEAYPYIAMLLPGMGPDDLETPLDLASALRCDLAAERYRAGLVPIIIPSGGHVHPDQTPYSEAVEMKRYLMETHGVPETAILIDPHARHTTTNLRNVTRLLIRYGFPVDRPVLTTTDLFQSAYILSMEGRCNRELGYVPWRSVVRLGDTDNCWMVHPASLHLAPADPLDP